MKREHLSTVTTEAQCHELAVRAMNSARQVVIYSFSPYQVGRSRYFIRNIANRIIALRTAELANAAQVAP